MARLNNIEIISRRRYETWPSMQIVYEWEDCLQKHLNCPITFFGCKNRLLNAVQRRVKRVLFYLGLPNGHLPFKKKTSKTISILFELSPESKDLSSNQFHIIPVIIDYHWREKEMKRFETKYNRCPCVLITSREVYEYLIAEGCKLKLYHWPLSLPDQYQIVKDDWQNRPYHLVLMGRQNAKLKGYLDRYCESNPQIKYLYSVHEKGTLNYYSNEGQNVTTVWNRADYWRVLKMGKVGFHSTPGIDGGEKRTQGFNQVTPKGFEILAAGCNILMKYAQNADTEYFEYPKFFKNIDTYDDFVAEFEQCLNSPPNYDLHQEYLNKHYTDKRVSSLKEILADLEVY